MKKKLDWLDKKYSIERLSVRQGVFGATSLNKEIQ
jgi:hypothetical protein